MFRPRNPVQCALLLLDSRGCGRGQLGAVQTQLWQQGPKACVERESVPEPNAPTRTWSMAPGRAPVTISSFPPPFSVAQVQAALNE
jgi:hypothetical protein